MPLSALGLAAATAGIQGGINSALGAGSGLFSGMLSKQLMMQQQQLAKQNFEMQNKRQDYLLTHSASMQRQNLVNAGYSPADPFGNGMSTPLTGNIQGPSNGSLGADFGKVDMMQAMRLGAEIRNIEADTQQKQAAAQGHMIDNNLKATYGAQQYESAIANLDASTQQQISQALYNDQQRLNQTNLTKAQVRNINERLDMDWQKLPPELKYLAAQTELADSSRALNYAKVQECWSIIAKAFQEIQLMKSQGLVNDAQVGVLVKQAEMVAQQTKLTEKQTKTEGARSVYELNKAELQQFETDVQKSMGEGFYQFEKVAGAILPLGFVGAAVSRLAPSAAPKTIKGFAR